MVAAMGLAVVSSCCYTSCHVPVARDTVVMGAASFVPVAVVLVAVVPVAVVPVLIVLTTKLVSARTTKSEFVLLRSENLHHNCLTKEKNASLNDLLMTQEVVTR